LTTNQRRLAESYTRATSFLSDHKIPFLPGQAGHHVWIDLKEYVHGDRAEERELYKELLNNGVYIGLGEAFHAEEPGWFSIAYAIEWETLKLALDRFITVLAKFRKD
jgi:1-aminocyclopropane-1-carboxylate synthase